MPIEPYPELGLQGASLTPLLRDPHAQWDRPAFTQVQFCEVPGRAVRTDRWRYVEWDGGRAGVELYDHRTDPREMNNLASDPKYADVIARLGSLLKRTSNSDS